MKAYTQNNLVCGDAVDPNEETHRRKILDFFNSHNTCDMKAGG